MQINLSILNKKILKNLIVLFVYFTLLIYKWFKEFSTYNKFNWDNISIQYLYCIKIFDYNI